jgi:hypothetical protein
MRYKLPIIVTLLIFTSLSAFFLRDYLSQILFIPIINIANFLWKIFASLPEIIWWVLLILGLVVFILKSVRFSIERKPKRVKDKSHRNGLASDWNKMIYQAKKSEYSRWLLEKKLASMALDVLAYQRGLTEAQVKDSIISQELHLPEEIRAFLLQGIHSPSFQHFLEIDQKQPKKTNFQNIEVKIDNLLNYLETDNK